MHAKAQILLLALLVFAIPAWSQVEPSASGGGESSEDDTQMMTPPPVSGMPYASEGTEGGRTNYLSASVGASAGYIDNAIPGYNWTGATTGENDTTYAINPSISLARSTPRQAITLTYNPSFTFYQPTSQLDSINQSASLVFSERLSPHLSFDLQNFFLRTNNVFSGSYPFSTGGLTGANQAPIPALIAPFAQQMTDTISGSLSYQFGLDGMIGGSGSYSNLDYPNYTQAVGIYNSSGESGSAFYSKRFSRSQYGGLSYSYSQYSGEIVHPTAFQTVTQTFSGFYTYYFNTRFSISLSGGAQDTSVNIPGSPSYNAWSPSGVASIGWQGKRGSISSSYLHAVTSGEGLYGAFYSDSESLSAGWIFGPRWTSSFGISYVNISPLTTGSSGSGPTNLFTGYFGGDTFTASASLSHTLKEHLSAGVGYDRLHESYPGNPTVLNTNPDSDQFFGSISYDFRKPLGR